MASSKNYTDLDSMVGSNGGSTGGRKKAPSKKGGQPTERARRIVKKLWIAAGCVVAAVMLFFIAAYNGWIGYMPPVEELKNPQDKFASVVLTSDGVEMGRFFKDQSNRVYADYSEISQNVIDALVATEDVRFESHSGIDLKALTRAVTKTLILGKKSAGGGSTITQQLAKLLYTPQSDGFYARMVQKPIEWMIAIKLERYYSKEEIIKMYLNQFDFLYNAVGIKSAAQVYFNKEAKDLSLLESALLVGMVKNPAYFNPVRHPERAINRRNVVLEQMVKAGMLDEDEYNRLCNEPLGLDFHRISHSDGIAPYFREELRRYLTAKKPDKNDYPTWDKESFVADSILWVNNPLYGWVQKNPKADGSYYNIYNDGLRIHTTIDSRMQAYAEEAVNEHMSDLQRRFFKEKAKSSRGPYTTNRDELSDDVYNRIVKNSINQSERARVARIAGKTEQELMAEFNTPYDMTLFSYSGPVDTTMTPLDSIKYVKSLLRTGFMAMDPRNGQVKAYVGGPDFRFMQYDMVSKVAVRWVRPSSPTSIHWRWRMARPRATNTSTPSPLSISILEKIGHLAMRVLPESAKWWTCVGHSPTQTTGFRQGSSVTLVPNALSSSCILLASPARLTPCLRSRSVHAKSPSKRWWQHTAPLPTRVCASIPSM